MCFYFLLGTLCRSFTYCSTRMRLYSHFQLLLPSSLAGLTFSDKDGFYGVKCEGVQNILECV